MKQFMLKPSIYKYDTAKAFAEEFKIGEGDLVITNEYIYQPFFGEMNLKCDRKNTAQGSLPMRWPRQCIRISMESTSG